MKSEFLDSQSNHSIIKTSFLFTKSNNQSLTDNIPKFSKTQSIPPSNQTQMFLTNQSKQHSLSQINLKTPTGLPSQNTMRVQEYDYFQINCSNKEEDSFSKYCESILNKVSTQNEKFPSEQNSFSDTKESFLQCKSVQNNSVVPKPKPFENINGSSNIKIDMDLWIRNEKFMSNRKHKRRNQSEKIIPENHRTRTEESVMDTPTEDQNKRFSDCFVKYSSISKDQKKLSIQNSFVIENRYNLF